MPVSKLTAQFLILPRTVKRVIALLTDCFLCILAVLAAYYLRLGELEIVGDGIWWAIGLSIFLAIPIFIVLGFYRAIFRYSGWPALLAVFKAVAIYGVIYSFLFTIIGIRTVPRTIGIIQPILLILFVGASRAFVRLWLGGEYLSFLRVQSKSKVLVYGVGKAGRELVAAMRSSEKMQIVGFLDDDDRLHGQIIDGLNIYDPRRLADFEKSLDIKGVLLAMPSISRTRRNEILNHLRSLHIFVQSIPSISDLARGIVSVADLRELDIDDLLGRTQVEPSLYLMSKNIANKTVIVTGAGGSIGGELCRQILVGGPAKLLMIDQSEFALYSIHNELAGLLGEKKVEIVPLLASIRDGDRIEEILATWRPHTIYHAAAYKHVPMVEHNPVEGVKNNVFGTYQLAKSALKNGVSDFVLVSTDKAVRPTSVMGASKRLAEIILQSLSARNATTKFCMVRFGNVLGSSGSVVPKFRQQIRAGGPITLTHNEITRYFMTISEAAQLVIQAGAMAQGGDVFVLDMGDPIKIYDLACRMVELSGLAIKDGDDQDGDIEIHVTGLRPGEKLYEELLIGNNPESTDHQKIMRAQENFLDWTALEPELKNLEETINKNDAADIRDVLKRLLPDYSPSIKVVDWVMMEQENGNISIH